MEEIGFRKRQSFARVTGIPLPEGIVPAFHMIGLTTFFTNRMMRFFWKHIGIGFPEIAIRLAMLVLQRDCLPEQAATFFATITDHKSHNLPCAATHRRPQPAFVLFFEHK